MVFPLLHCFHRGACQHRISVNCSHISRGSALVDPKQQRHIALLLRVPRIHGLYIVNPRLVHHSLAHAQRYWQADGVRRPGGSSASTPCQQPD